MISEKTVLLVEDNPDHEFLALHALNEANLGNAIRIARDGEEALRLLHGAPEEALPALPQVVLLDMKLPKIDGLEVLEKIRSHPRTMNVPVVVLTSSDEEADVARSYKLGVNSYIRKPINFNDFVTATQQLGMYWLVLNECVPDTAGQ